MKRHGAALVSQCSPPANVDDKEELTLLFEAYANDGEEGLRQALNELYPELEQQRFSIV
jgi:hypothetical protein